MISLMQAIFWWTFLLLVLEKYAIKLIRKTEQAE